MPHRKQKHQRHSSATEVSDFGLLFFKADGSQVTIQHSSTQADGASRRPASVPSLRLDLRTGKVWVGPAAALPADSAVTLGIIGLLQLERGSILVLISKAKRVCGLLDGPVYKVEDTTLVAPEAINDCPNDLRYASLLQEALNPKSFGGHLYFSHTANITSSRQRQQQQATAPPFDRDGDGGTAASAASNGCGGLPSLGAWWAGGADKHSAGLEGRAVENAGAAPAGSGVDAGPGPGAGTSGTCGGAARGGGGGRSARSCGTLWSRADPRFIWNRELMRPLLDAGAESFALPMMAGYVGQATGATFTLKPKLAEAAVAAAAAPVEAGLGGGCRAPGDLTLITRLGVERPVAGSWRRGADKQGHTAGFAETEVVLTLWQPEGGEAARSGGQVEDSNTEVCTTDGPGGGDAAAAEKLAGDVGGENGWVRRRTRVAVASYVMARGSIPLFWAAPPDLRPCPAPGGPDDPNCHSGPFAEHVQRMHTVYGKPLLLLNLILGANQRQQLRLHDTLQQQVAAFCDRVRQQWQQQKQREGDGTAASTGSGERAAAEAAASSSGVAAAASGEGQPAGGDGAGAGRSRDPRWLPGGVSVVGWVVEAGELAEMALCGGAAARLEREVAAVAPDRMGAFLSLDDLEMAVQLPISTAGPTQSATATPSSAANTETGSIHSCGSRRPRTVTTCVGRQVFRRQEGVVRVSSASSASAGGCCEEVDIVQHCLALPLMAEALVAVGAMDDPADMREAHASVMNALAQLWSHQADVLSDQTHGTASQAGRMLRAAVAHLEPPVLSGAAARWLLQGPYDRIVWIGDAVSRYYYSNFTDARRQDAIDLAAGVFKLSTPPAELPRRRPPSTGMLQLGILLLVASIIQATILLFQRPTGLGEVGTRVLIPAALGCVLLVGVLRQGAAFVEQPLLPPQNPGSATYPWAL